MTQYLVCPFEKNVCGPERTIKVTKSLSEKTMITNLNQDNKASSDFILGKLCSYELLWPEEDNGAQIGDSIFIKAAKLPEGASAYIASGAGGITANEAMSEIELIEDGQKLVEIQYPANIYITVKAASSLSKIEEDTPLSFFLIEAFYGPSSSSAA